jgi:16S rRNA (guanine966-N2)-methyltransferase
MAQQSQQVRIIGGKWRSRKISFIDLDGLRPTTDPTRETLFNWLAPFINDANCLDLFAGSGALSFEALSRGAKHVVTIDKSPKVIAKLKENAQTLGTTDITFFCLAIPQELTKVPQQMYDIVFVDPPFHHNLVNPTCAALAATNLLAPDALIFVEVERQLAKTISFPPNWEMVRNKSAGVVDYFLLRHINEHKK